MKKYLPISILVFLFLILKLSNFGIRLSDSNIYFYTGYKILQGKILYRDIFFTDFLLFPYISAIYNSLTAGNLSLFFLIPTLEVSVVAFLIYLIVYKEHNDSFIAFCSSALYLFSFIILSTSDHETGVFIATVFAVLSYYFYLHKKYFLTGVFIALAILTKAYFLPILLSYIILFFWQHRAKRAVNFYLGGILTAFAVLLPTIKFAYQYFIKDVFIYSLTRTQGVDKGSIIWFFITHDFALFILLLFSLLTIRKNKFFGFISLFGIVFFLLYKDTYYLYLNFLVPFLALSYPKFYETIQKSFSPQRFIVPTILFCFLIYSFGVYMIGYRNLGKLDNVSGIVDVIKKQSPKSLYGVDDITAAFSYLSGVPLVDNVIDTNANIYRKGVLDAKKMTQDAISQKSVLITHGAYYPDARIRQDIIDEIFDKEQIGKSCKLIASFPVQMEGVGNRLNLFRCY